MKAQIKGIGTYRLVLDNGCHLDLEKCLYVPDCARNLVSVGKLDECNFNVKFENGTFSLFKNKYYYGCGTLINGFYHFNLDEKSIESVFHVEHIIGSKRSAHDDNSAYLWHQRLGHISKERIMRLVKNEILPQLDFSDLNVCVDCIKGKLSKQAIKANTLQRKPPQEAHNFLS